MAGFFEVYDNERVQLITRRQAAVTFLVFAAAVGETILLAILARESLLPVWLVIALTVAVWAVAAMRMGRHFRRTNHVVWCVKLSDAQIAGYDHARRQTCLDWSDVRQIEVGRRALRVKGCGDEQLEIPHLFDDFATLSHRIVEQAERNQIPIMIEGRPLDEIDLYALYPFLGSPESEPGSHGGSLRV